MPELDVRIRTLTTTCACIAWISGNQLLNVSELSFEIPDRPLVPKMNNAKAKEREGL